VSVSTFLANAGALSNFLPDVIEFGPANATSTDYLDFVNNGRMQRENTLYTDAFSDFSNRKRFPVGSVGTADDQPLLKLNSLFVTFFDLHMYLNSITGFKIRDICPEHFVFKLFDNVHAQTP